MITEETIARVKSSLIREKAFLTLEVIENLENQIEQLKKDIYLMRNCENCDNYGEICKKCYDLSKWEKSTNLDMINGDNNGKA